MTIRRSEISALSIFLRLDTDDDPIFSMTSGRCYQTLRRHVPPACYTRNHSFEIREFSLLFNFKALLQSHPLLVRFIEGPIKRILKTNYNYRVCSTWKSAWSAGQTSSPEREHLVASLYSQWLRGISFLRWNHHRLAIYNRFTILRLSNQFRDRFS